MFFVQPPVCKGCASDLTAPSPASCKILGGGVFSFSVRAIQSFQSSFGVASAGRTRWTVLRSPPY